MSMNTDTAGDRDTDKDRDSDSNTCTDRQGQDIDMDKDSTEINADGSDTPTDTCYKGYESPHRTFVQRGLIPCRNLVRGVQYPTEICLRDTV
jgi:hypothetical protein